MPEIPLQAYNICIFSRSPRLELVYMSLSLSFGSFFSHTLKDSQLKVNLAFRCHDIFCDSPRQHRDWDFTARWSTEYLSNGRGRLDHLFFGDI